MITRELVFELPKTSLITSNDAKDRHFFVKNKKAQALRTLAAEQGLLLHDDENKKAVQERIDALEERQKWQNKKSAITKRMKSRKASAAEIEEEIENAIGNKASYEAVNAIEVPFLFRKAEVEVYIGGSTKRAFDPPNFWPSVKALTDGLTDCAWWEDDSFDYVTKVSFSYGEMSEIKGHYKIRLVVRSVEEG